MYILVHKIGIILINIHVIDICLVHCFLSSDSEVMTLHKVSSPHTSFFKTFNKLKTKLVLY